MQLVIFCIPGFQSPIQPISSGDCFIIVLEGGFIRAFELQLYPPEHSFFLIILMPKLHITYLLFLQLFDDDLQFFLLHFS